MTNRREFLGLVASAGVATSGAMLPRAIEAATLDATVTVLDAWEDQTGEIGNLRVHVSNDRPSDGDPITVVGNCWGVGRMTQVPWDVARGEWPVIQPGERDSIHFVAPGEEEVVRLQPDKRAMIRIYDKGTEERAHDSFIPSEVSDK